MESGGGEAREWTVPETLEEAYELRDAAATPEKREFYQEHVYRLRAEEYRSRGVRIEESSRRREENRAGARRAGEDAGSSWWKRVLGRWK